MSVEPAGASLVREILQGENRELRKLAADGLIPLGPEELVPLQVELTASGDEDLAERAVASLAGHTPRIVARVLAEAETSVLHYFARTALHPVVVEAILRRRDVPIEVLVEIAPRLEPALQEILVLRQDAIVEEPGILDALETNPKLGNYARRRIREYREHLIARPRPVVEEPVAEDEVEAVVVEVAAEVEAPEAEIAEAEDADVALESMSESQIRNQPMQIRLKLTRGASKTLRNVLIRDPHPMVALSVLANNSLGDPEIEKIAGSRTVVADVLEAIARNPKWTRKYGTLVALVKNPRTPVANAVRMCSKLSVRDLRSLIRDHNCPDAVRSQARRMYRIKTR